ncbi:hypothetical protein CQY20_07350 [Mycolicibacterium agri]|uniref:DUF1254 domain-containing protein n=1 Tax=Mycolicibacterium agri TaxID=36811 RepID=A0A2A7NAB0_MYCAG|nr:DUF1254 domain-containing protein [Mycolicibacterium agri]PEG40398.1 hypothetical protein CQY20_07350 [Mycolicibacterium agri]GFG51903.1 hypothetical protein MAGR_33440 [Mycolicibacterium agri]
MRTLWQRPGPSAGPPSDPAEIADRALHRRAIEAVIWGMPAVNFELMRRQMVKLGGAPNQVVFWSQPATWKNQTLTPNPDTIYFMPFFDTADVGPVVLEIPPADTGAIVGSVDDCWQTAIADVGVAGVDNGAGGRYVILPPDHTDAVPAGYIPLPLSTYQSFAVLRSNYRNATADDIADAVAYGKRVRVYPLSTADRPPETVFIDAKDILFDATIPYDARFFDPLNKIVQTEPWLARDKAMIDRLKTIGIEKGRPFVTTDKTRRILTLAAHEVRAWLSNRLETSYFPPPYFVGGHWHVPASPDVLKGLATDFADPDGYPVDDRAVAFSMVFFSPKKFGSGQFYLMTLKDGKGNRLDGGSTYRLRVPASVPVRQYWSATAYDGETHALIRETPWASRSSTTPGLATNPNGSVDICFGPVAPAGAESNWIPTKACTSFEVIFRFFGPEQALFDKTWKLPEIERIDAHAADAD